MRFWKHGADAKVPLSMLTSFASAQVHYRWDGKRLVPALIHQRVFPGKRPPAFKGKRWVLPYVWVDGTHQCLDANGDGAPETLQVQMVHHLEPATVPGERPDPKSGELRAHLLLHKGVLPEALNGFIDKNVKPASNTLPVVNAQPTRLLTTRSPRSRGDTP